MKNAVLSGLRQAVGARLVLGAFAMAAVIFLASMDTLLLVFQSISVLPAGYHLDFLGSALRADMVAPFVPILAVLPFAGSYVDDIKSKFARFCLVRSGYGAYLFSRVLVCFLCGGLVIAGGIGLAWGGAALLFTPMERASGTAADPAPLVRTALMLVLSGGLWAVVGMAMSTLMESKYIAYASPFVMYYLLVILYERYFPDAYMIYPREWLMPSEKWPFGCGGAAVLVAELTVLFALLFTLRAGRRLREL